MAPDVQLRPDQIEDLTTHLAHDRHILGHEPGVGKTPIACVLAYARWQLEGAKTVWPQPNSLLSKNRREMLRFSGFTEGDVVILRSDHQKLTKDWTGPTLVRDKKKRHNTGKTDPETQKPIYSYTITQEVAADLIAASAGAKVILCSFRFWAKHWRRLLEVHPEINHVLIDEAHKAYGSTESQLTQELYASMRHIKYMTPMTATLLRGKLDTVFPILHLIEPRYYGSYDGFLAQHAGWIDTYGNVTQWLNTEKVRLLLARHSTRRLFRDVYGPEAVVFFHEEVEMSEAHFAKYNEFHAQAMLELENGEILDGALPGVATIRARQIMAHPETMGIAVGEMTGKDERLEVHEGSSGPMIIFASLVPEQERIVRLMQKLGRKVKLINGSVSSVQRGKIDEDFSAGRIDCIVGSPQTADVGFNWGAAEHIIFVSTDYDDVTWTQAYRRGLRGKRDKPLRVTTLAYENSIDQRVYKIMEAKSALANEVDPSRPILKFAA